ncbi:MAG: alpha/beta fold hydrolase [Bryobacteraceae bacterium]|nr:alpha/beta fold hydrolase [Bryobacteraceae bacterium]
MKIVYLHGFASSPLSSKAQYFRRGFKALGREVSIPALDGGSFETLTITGQLKRVAEAAGEDEVALIGSSLGGYLAALFAARRPDQVRKVVLMAPALRFPRRWQAGLGPQAVAEWERTDRLPVFHYGFNERRYLRFELLRDALTYEDDPPFLQAGLLFHGRNDPVVPVSDSIEFAASRSWVELRLFDSGHELTDVVQEMFEQTAHFLGSP